MTTPKRQWLPAVERAELVPLKFHELRLTAVVFMIDDGADPLQVKRRMGHEDVRTTFNLYGHLSPTARMSWSPPSTVAGEPDSNARWTRCGPKQAPRLLSSTAKEPLTRAYSRWTRGELNP